MTTPTPIFTLAEQAIGFRPDISRVLVVQRWTGFSHGRHALAISVNDRVTGSRPGTPGQVANDFAKARDQLAAWAVDETRARDELERINGIRSRRCEDCHAELPIGGLYCVRCGTPGGRPVTPAWQNVIAGAPK